LFQSFISPEKSPSNSNWARLSRHEKAAGLNRT
jgi:hypothetical protein